MHVAEATQTVATEYNGWSNRETWVVNLWLTSDEVLYDELMRLTKLYRDTHDLAEVLELWVQDELDEQTEPTHLWRDLLTTALYRVNWFEIADSNQ